MDTKGRERKKKVVNGKDENANYVYRPPHASNHLCQANSIDLCNNSPPILNNYLHYNNPNDINQAVNHLELSAKLKPKQPKLLSSKSLSLLIPRSLFFRSSNKHETSISDKSNKAKSDAQLPSTKSLPNWPSIVNSTAIELAEVNQEPNCQVKNKLKFKLSRNSTSKSSLKQGSNNSHTFSLDQPNVSPIVGVNVGLQKSIIEGFSLRSDGLEVCEAKKVTNKGNENEEKEAKNKADKKRYKALKNTGLVLRDVKNSIALVSLRSELKKSLDLNFFSHTHKTTIFLPVSKLSYHSLTLLSFIPICLCHLPSRNKPKIVNCYIRNADHLNELACQSCNVLFTSKSKRMRAKHESQAFCKFANEPATPPTTKLYSPFNIDFGSTNTRDMKRREAMLRNKASMCLASTEKNINKGNCSLMEMDYEPIAGKDSSMIKETPAKRRVALQHKRHLIQANKFTFDSPTGRLRETVRDVEQFQQCIEDISKAIKERGQ